MVPLILWNIFVSFFLPTMLNYLAIKGYQPLAKLAAQSCPLWWCIRSTVYLQLEIKVRGVEAIQRVVNLIHPVYLSLLSRGITNGDCFQIKLLLPIQAYQKVWMGRDFEHLRMKFEVKAKAQE